MRQIPDGENAQLTKGLRTGTPTGEQGRDGQRPHFLRNFTMIQRVCLIRLLKIRRHFRKDLSVRDSHIYCEFEFFEDRMPDVGSGLTRRGVVCRNGSIVHIAFIYADLLDVRADIRQVFHEQLAFCAVHIVVRRCHNEMGTLAQGIHDRFAGSDTVGLGGYGFCQYHTMPGSSVAANDGRNRAQIHRISLLKPMQGGPA